VVELEKTDTVPENKSELFTAVEIQPTFPGGNFAQFLATNVRYPQTMRDNNIQGRVIVNFVVEKDGSLSDIKAVRSPGYGAAEEAVRVMSLSPKWNPGIQNGRRVRVQFSVPINFALENSKTTGQVAGVTLSYALPDTTKKSVRIIGHSNILYIVDGKEMDAGFDMSLLDPHNIESISILKDKSAKAIYGAKGDNGIITTKDKKTKSPDNLTK
jgi:TonB family protein